MEPTDPKVIRVRKGDLSLLGKIEFVETRIAPKSVELVRITAEDKLFINWPEIERHRDKDFWCRALLEVRDGTAGSLEVVVDGPTNS